MIELSIFVLTSFYNFHRVSYTSYNYLFFFVYFVVCMLTDSEKFLIRYFFFLLNIVSSEAINNELFYFVKTTLSRSAKDKITNFFIAL